MARIVCATRAGEGSRAVQMAAIARSLKTGQQLDFLYVIDPSSLGTVEETLSEAVQAELTWMGKTLLRVAEKRADAAGVRAELVIRQGGVRDEICNYVMESHAGLLLIGAPRGTSATVFGDEEIEHFAVSIHQTTGVPVEIIRPEAVEDAALRHSTTQSNSI